MSGPQMSETPVRLAAHVRQRASVVPPALALAKPLDMLLCGALAGLGFVLLFSVAGVSLMLAVLAVLALAAAPAVWRSAPWREPVIAVGLILLAYIAVHTIWTSGFTSAAWQGINRYHELMMAPVLLALFRIVSGKRLFFQGLICGALAYAAAHWTGTFWPQLARYLEPRHISAGFGLALCAYVLLEQARHSPRPWPSRIAALFLAVTVLFAVGGRTGHLVLLLLVACAAWLHSPRRWRWAMVVVVPLVVLVMGLGSNAVQKRMADTLSGSQQGLDGTLSSTGIRIELLRTGLDLVGIHFLAGAGFARYAQVHEQSALARYGSDPERRVLLKSQWPRTTNPHNEYLMQLVGGGVAALALFLAWLTLPMLRAGRRSGVRASLVGIALAFALGCLFNSLLMDFVEGHVYVALLAWLLAQAADAPANAPANASTIGA